MEACPQIILGVPGWLADSLRLPYPSVAQGLWCHPRHLPHPFTHSPPCFPLHTHVSAGDPAAEPCSPVGRRCAGLRAAWRGTWQITFLQLVPNIIQTQLFRQTQIAHPINTEGLIPRHLSEWGKMREKGDTQEAFESWPGVVGRRGAQEFAFLSRCLSGETHFDKCSRF